MQMAMVFTPQKPTQRDRFGEIPEDLPGSTERVGLRGKKRQELGRPYRLLPRTGDARKSSHGIWIMSHGRGNPDTEVGRSLNEVEADIKGFLGDQTQDSQEATASHTEVALALVSHQSSRASPAKAGIARCAPDSAPPLGLGVDPPKDEFCGRRRRMGIEPTHRGLNPEHWI